MIAGQQDAEERMQQAITAAEQAAGDTTNDLMVCIGEEQQKVDR